MALAQRRPQEVIHHSDSGRQYTSYAFGKRCREMGVMPSMGSVGDAYDNAMAKSFFATLERELLNRRRFKARSEAGMAVFEWIEGWYNPHRRHSSLGHLSPVKTTEPRNDSCLGNQPSTKTGQPSIFPAFRPAYPGFQMLRTRIRLAFHTHSP